MLIKLNKTAPLSLSQCFSNGIIDMSMYRMYKKRKNSIMSLDNLLQSISKKPRMDNLIEGNTRKPMYRTVKKHQLYYRKEDGSINIIGPKDTTWYKLYVCLKPYCKEVEKKFRLRFCLPYNLFHSMYEEMRTHELFEQWENKDATGMSSTDLRLLILGALRYIGKSFIYDDLEEATTISRETHRFFLKKNIKYGSTVLYKKYVIDPANEYMKNKKSNVFELAGMNGCFGSTDATHVALLSCPNWATNSHKSYKLNITSRTYNKTVTHERQILSSTSGHPATWNDKSLIMSDSFYDKVRKGKLLKHNKFKLQEQNESGAIVEIEYQGG